MERDKEYTDVVFRVFKEGDVIALFPLIPEGPGLCCSYQHIGQHGSASFGLISTTRPATKAEYKALWRELQGLGYCLRLRKRLPSWRVLSANAATQ